MLPAELWAEFSAHSFWKRGTTVMFDVKFINLDAGSYLRTISKNVLGKAEKEKKYKHLQA